MKKPGSFCLVVIGLLTLAPKGYMAAQGLTIAPKDRVTVAGSLISVLGRPFLLAMEVQGDSTMKLREASGRPAWAVGEDWHVRSTSREITSALSTIDAKP